MDERMTWDEAIKLLMQRTGKNKRQATAMLVEACRQGKVPAYAYDLKTGEDLDLIPPETFPKVN